MTPGTRMERVGNANVADARIAVQVQKGSLSRVFREPGAPKDTMPSSFKYEMDRHMATDRGSLRRDR